MYEKIIIVSPFAPGLLFFLKNYLRKVYINKKKYIYMHYFLRLKYHSYVHKKCLKCQFFNWLLQTYDGLATNVESD